MQLGILGYPLGHSLSPILHETLMAEMDIQGSYRLYEAEPAELEKAVQMLRTAGCQGYNVTIPHKVRIIPCLDSLSSEARILQAVNTVLTLSDGHLKGFNTDLAGFLQSLPGDRRERLPESHVLILGAGGGARAVLGGLIQHKTKAVHLAVRSHARAADTLQLAADFCREFGADTQTTCGLLDDLPSLEAFDLIVNTTPVGMSPNGDNTPLSADLLATAPAHLAVYDLIYRPLETRLLREAGERGLATFNGLEMLIFQGVAAFEIWTGQTVPQTRVPLLRKKLIAAVNTPV